MRLTIATVPHSGLALMHTLDAPLGLWGIVHTEDNMWYKCRCFCFFIWTSKC